jgi:hypothetical protein
MLTVALVILSATVVLGIALGLLYLRGGTRPPWMVGVLHGLFGTAGIATLILALRGPPRGLLNGVASFGAIAAVLACVALVAGLGVVTLARWSGCGVGLMIAVHGSLAITAYVLLIAYVALG